MAKDASFDVVSRADSNEVRNAVNMAQKEIATRYDDAFAGLGGIELPQRAHRGRSAHHIYVTRMDFPRLGRTRGEVMLHLRAKGIGSQVHYIPVPYQPYYRAHGLGDGAWPHAERYYEQALTIPLYFGMTDDDVAAVIEAVTDLAEGARGAAAMVMGRR